MSLDFLDLVRVILKKLLLCCMLTGVSKEKVCDETGVELQVEARAEWLLQRPPYSSSLHPPLPCTNPLLCQPDPPTPTEVQPDDERWLSQVCTS